MPISSGFPKFDGGERRAQVEVQQSQRRILIETYGSVVRTALKEVDDALSNADSGARLESAQQQTVEQAQRSLNLAEIRYREGVGDPLATSTRSAACSRRRTSWHRRASRDSQRRLICLKRWAAAGW